MSCRSISRRRGRWGLARIARQLLVLGYVLGKAFEPFAIRHLVIERDPDIIRRLRVRGTPYLYGDASHREFARHSWSPRGAASGIRADRAYHAPRPFPQSPGAGPGACPWTDEAAKLIAVGSTEVIQPEVEASAMLIRHAMSQLMSSVRRSLNPAAGPRLSCFKFCRA